MPILRPCLVCGTLSKRSRCPLHTTAKAATEQFPWAFFYWTDEWQKARNRVRRRDGYRCTHAVSGRRCRNTMTTAWLEVHHIIPVRELWEHCGGNIPEFMLLATDENNLKTLCGRHHRIEERGQAQTPQKSKAMYAGTAKARRRRRHGKRQEEKAINKVTRDERMRWKES